MTFTGIVNRVCQRLNLTSAAAIARIGEEVNDVFREVVSSVNLATSVRSTITALTTEDSRYVTFGSEDPEDEDRIIKIQAVFLPDDTAPPPWNVLQSVTFDEMRNILPTAWPPTLYAIDRVGATSVRIFLNAEAPDDETELHADVLLASDTMSGTDQPFFPENFHDIIVYGVMAIELDKMEKEDRAQRSWAQYEKRMSELRYFLSIDAYLRIHQGKRGWDGNGTGFGGSLVQEMSRAMLSGDFGDSDVPVLVEDDGTVVLSE